MCDKNIKYEILYSAFPYDFRANYSRAGRFGHGFYGNTSGVADENTIYGYDANGERVYKLTATNSLRIPGGE